MLRRLPDLTPHQQQALEAIYARLESEERFTVLQGYAGTGKTYLIGQLIRRLAREHRYVRVCAPTHKAAQVLQKTIHNGAIRAQTIHAFLGLRLVPDRKGGYTLEPERGRRPPVEGVVIVDEASMVGMQEWAFIEKAAGIQWIFVGDPAQLPPVNEDPSPVFGLDGPMLDEIVRQQEDNPILALATRIRRGESVALDAAFADGQGIGVTRRRDAFLRSAIRSFEQSDFKRDGSFARVLAYRNRTVQHYNAEIRSALFGRDAERFRPGEWLVARDTWFFEGVPLITNSEEVQVVEATMAEDSDLETGSWTVWILEVRSGDEGATRHLRVLHEREFDRYNDRLARLKHEALNEKGDWHAYYALQERFARVDYAYAMTVHKAQGSTFDTAYVDYRDTLACRGNDRQALLYVAVTRPAKRLALLV